MAAVNLVSKLLKNKSFTYNPLGSVNVKFVFEDGKVTDLKLIPGDYILITYMDSTLKLVQDKCTIQNIIYDIDQYISSNEKVLTIHMYSESDGDLAVQFSTIYDIVLLSPSTLYEGASLSENTIIVNDIKDLSNPVEGYVYYVNTNIITGAGTVLTKGLYQYIDGDFITTESAADISTEEGDYRVLKSIEEMESIAAYEGLLVSVPVTKAITNLTVDRAIEGIRFGQIDTMNDGIIIQFKDITRSIVASNGKIYYKCNEDGSITGNSVLLYDGESFTDKVDSENTYWFSTSNAYMATLQPLSFIGVDQSNVIYQYNNGEWVDFANLIQNSESGDTYITSAYIGYANKESFPKIGKKGIFYIDYFTSEMYIWNPDKYIYDKVLAPSSSGGGSNMEDIAVIYCGTSDVSKDKDVSGLITLSEIL